MRLRCISCQCTVSMEKSRVFAKSQHNGIGFDMLLVSVPFLLYDLHK